MAVTCDTARVLDRPPADTLLTMYLSHYILYCSSSYHVTYWSHDHHMTLPNLYRILCTHHVRFLSRADVVVVLEGGRVKECGPPEVVLPHLPHQSSSEEESGSPKSEGKEDKNGRRSEKVKKATLILVRIKQIFKNQAIVVSTQMKKLAGKLSQRFA